jgi:glycosyltransferase involved in cell wall biosynthesis
MLSYSFYGSDTRVQQYARALADRGDDVDVLSLRHEGYPTEEIVDGVKVQRIQTRRRDERGPLTYLYRIVRFLIRASIIMTRQHRARPYDLIHIHSVPDFLVFAALIPRWSGARVILDIHDILPEFYASKFQVSPSSLVFRFLKRIERWSIAFADHVIIANHLWYERLISRSVRREKCTPICNYPDLRYFFPHTRTRTDGKFIMMYPGTLNWHQGLDVAVKAFAKIVDQAPHAEFHIYGEGPTRPLLVELAQSLGLNGRIQFYDLKPLHDIIPVMSQADLAVVPKRAESFGNEAVSTKVLEFMALGIPVLQSRTKVGTYYDTESRVKFFESENVDDLAQCMLLLIRDRQLRERLVAAALEHVKENNWTVKKHQYLELVDSLMDLGTCREETRLKAPAMRLPPQAGRPKLRVCHLAYTFYQNDPRTMQYARASVERGDEVDVIGLKREDCPAEEIIDGVKVLRIQGRRRDERGPLTYLFRIVRFLLHSSIVLTRKHRAQPYDLIHVHSNPDFLVFAALIPRLLGARVILDIHDILPEFYASKFQVSQSSFVFRLLKRIERWSIAFAHHVIIANDLWYERLISRSVQRQKCTPICNYPDPYYFFPRPRSRTDGKFIMMYPGTLNWHQGLDVAVRAFAKIVDQAPHAEFHIYGEGPTRRMLVELAQSLGLNGRIHFDDLKPYDEIAQIMSQADLVVVPKRADSFGNEAVSTKVLEFMALGIPVLQSRTKVGTYYDTESRVKFFESENVDDLARCMLLLIRDQQLRECLVANALEHVKGNNWTVKKHVYLDLVDSLMGLGTRREETHPSGAS